jgi:hypothetical protein
MLFWLPVLGVGAWLLNAFVVSEMLGWTALARQFPCGRDPTGKILRDCVIGISAGPGLVNSLHSPRRSSFGLFASVDGLYLDAGSPRRIGWPAVLIPWTNVAVIARRNLFGTESFELRLGSSIIYLTVTHSAFQQIEPFLL